MTHTQGTQPPPAEAGDSDPSVKEKAADTAQAAKQAGAEVAQTAADKAKDVAEETKRQARDLVGEARGQVRQQATDQKQNLVNNLRSLSDELHRMTQHPERSGVATEVAAQADDRIQGMADWLERREPGDLLEEVRSFARRRPGAFLLGSAFAGVLAGRLTRGVAAVHSEDSGSGSATAVGRQTAGPGFDAAVGSAGYETETIGDRSPAAGVPAGVAGGTPPTGYGIPSYPGAGSGIVQPGANPEVTP